MINIFEIKIIHSWKSERSIGVDVSRSFNVVAENELIARDKAIGLLRQEVAEKNYKVDDLIISWCDINHVCEAYE